MNLDSTLCESFARVSKSKPFCDSVGTSHCVNVMLYHNKSEIQTMHLPASHTNNKPCERYDIL